MDVDTENSVGFGGFLNTKFDINSRWSVPASVAYNKAPRARDTARTQNVSRTPLDVENITASLGVTRHFNRLSLSLIGDVQTLRHEDGEAVDNTSTIIYSDNNRSALGAQLSARYSFLRAFKDTAEHIAYADFKVSEHDYKQRSYQNNTFSGPRESHKRYDFKAGFETQYKKLAFANLGIGYSALHYDDTALDNIDLITLNGDISYMLTPRVALNAGAHRHITQEGDFLQGYKDIGGHIGVDFEARHNVFLNGNFSYQDYDFENSSRRDDKYDTRIGLRYHNSHRIETHLHWHHQNVESTNPTQGYNRSVIMLSLINKI